MALVWAVVWAGGATSVGAQIPYKITEADLTIDGVSATVEPTNPAVPKNVATGLRVRVAAGEHSLDASEVVLFLGGVFEVRAELSGPGLTQTRTLASDAAEDPLLLRIPPLQRSGDYAVANLRLVRSGRSVLDIRPSRLTLKVLEKILITSVEARPLTHLEALARGIIMDEDAWLSFDFTLGLKMESERVDLSFPVVFDRRGVAIPPLLPVPPERPKRHGLPLKIPPLPTVVPLLLLPEKDGATGPQLELTDPSTSPVRIPSLLVIPGNVGYWKQFFSAQLFVANGAPGGSGLQVRGVTGTIDLPAGDDRVPGSGDDPLSLAAVEGEGAPSASLPVKNVGPDGEPGTGDDGASLLPGEQGRAEFLLRGEQEGFHTMGFDIEATLEGLPTGPVRVTGQAQGGVLVRNAKFDLSFTAPTVVHAGERFKLFATVTNTSRTEAAGVRLALAADQVSGARLSCAVPPCDPVAEVGTLAAGDSRTVELLFESDRTGEVVASYLKAEAATSSLHFTLGVGERGVPLSPDTLGLPTSVDGLPAAVVGAAMRVLGQAWSVAQAPREQLASTVLAIDARIVREKALTLAEAGLRVALGQAPDDVLRDLAFDFYGGTLDPGFDQVLRETEAGRAFARALGSALVSAVSAAGGPAAHEGNAAVVAASGPDFLSFSVRGTAGAVDAMLVDAAGRSLEGGPAAAASPKAQIPGAAILPLGPPTSAPLWGLLSAPTLPPYTLKVSGPAELSFTFPRGDGGFARGTVTTTHQARVLIDFGHPESVRVEEDADGDGLYERAGAAALSPVASTGPRLVASVVVGRETLRGASPMGTQAALVFDRVVDEASAGEVLKYTLRQNAVLGARRQLSGRLVFLGLERPEGPYLPTTVSAAPLTDRRGVLGSAGTVTLWSRSLDPGAIVSGRVVNADGTPFSSGLVYYSNSRRDPACLEGGMGVVAAVRPETDGRYELRYVRQDPCGGPFRMEVRDPFTGAARSVTLFVRSGGEHIVADLALLGRGSVTGVVSGSSGPAPGAQVVAVSLTDPSVGRAATTDGDGRYLIRDLPVGAFNLRAAHGLYLGRATGRIEHAGATAVVNVALEEGSARIAGRVFKLEDGRTTPVPGVAVRFSMRSGGGVLAFDETDAGGGYALEGMPPGDFRLEAYLNTRDKAVVESRADSGQVLEGLDLVIEVQPDTEFGVVKGTVRMPGGAPAAGVIVTASGRGVLSGADGTYEIPGLPLPSNPRIVAQTRDGLRTGHAYAVLSPAQRVAAGIDITLSGLGRAEFRVVDASGAPVQYQAVALLGGCGNPCGCLTRFTDVEGIARFEGRLLGGVTAKTVRFAPGKPTDVAEGSTNVEAEGTTGYGLLRLAGEGTVHGVVRDATTHAPVQGARVELTSSRFVNDELWTCGLEPRLTHTATTGENGRFHFTGVNAGPVSVLARQSFYNTSASARGTLTGNGDFGFTLELADTMGGELSGQVSLPDGEIPAGAGIEVTVNGPVPDVTVRTDATGHYAFARVLPKGHYTLTARDPFTGGVVRKSIYLRAQEAAVHDLRLLGRGTVVVTVVDGAQQLVASARVRLRQTEFPNRVYEGMVEAANDGVVRLEDVVEGPFAVEAQDVYGRGGRSSGVVSPPGATVPVKVALNVTGSVHGHFRMPLGEPIPFGSVRLVASGRTLGQVTTQADGDTGAFSFDYVPAGPLRLEAEDPQTGRTGIAVATLETQDQDLELDVIAQALGTVRGEVTSNEMPQAGAYVDLVSGRYRVSTTTDAEGLYEVPGVPEGRVVATASLDHGFLKASQAGTLAGEGASLTLDVALRPTGEVGGVVTEADGDDPALAQVSLQVGGTGGGSFLHTTSPEGAFEFGRVPAGAGDVDVDALGSIDRAHAEVEVPAAGRVELVLKLNGVGSIRGRALASEATPPNPVPTAGQLTLSGSGEFRWFQSLQLGPDGLFSMPEVLAGPFTARLRTKVGSFTLYGTATSIVEPGREAQIDVQLQPSGTVKGRVVREGEAPAFGAEVTLQHQKGTAITQAQADGQFEFRGAPVGVFSVRVFDPFTTGRAAVRNLRLDTAGQVLDLGTLVLDVRPPTIEVVQPADGSTRGPIGGRIELRLADADSGVDTASLTLRYAGGRVRGASYFTFDGALALGNLEVGLLAVGTNTLRFDVKDLAGNLATKTVSYVTTGATVRGRVRWGTGADVPGALVEVGAAAPVPTGADGTYAKTGLRPGSTTVKATDPATGLSTTVGGVVVFDGEEHTVDLMLPAYGFVRGLVKTRGGAPAAGVTVETGGRAATTGADGRFDLGALPLGTHTLDATDARGDKGRASVTLVRAGESTEGLIVLNGVGSVTVTVRQATGEVVPGARVTLTTSAPLGETRSGTADAGGLVSFTKVLAGTVTAFAQDPARGLGGQSSAVLADGGAASLTVTLAPAGRILGTVREKSGEPAAGVSVSVTGGPAAEAPTDAEGRFSIEGVPLGVYTVKARRASTWDFGEAKVTLAAGGATATPTITLNGVGRVRVVVRNAGGERLPAVFVLVTSSALPSDGRSGVTDAGGVIEFPAILAGKVEAKATHRSLQLSGTASGDLAHGRQLELAVSIEDVGAIRGRVLDAGGVTPAAGVVVSTHFVQGYVYSRSVTTGADGAHVLHNLPLRPSYTVNARLDGHLRAQATVALTEGGQVVERDLVMNGAGTVRGLVTDPAGTPAPGASITLDSRAPAWNGTWYATSGADGRYSIAEVPIGPFAISAARSSRGERVDLTGVVAEHREVVTVDLPMLANSVVLGTSGYPLLDGNNVSYSIKPDGSYRAGGGGNLAVPSPTASMPALRIERGGRSEAFVGGGASAATEDGKREIVIRQAGLLGLDLTRKAFVPYDGYFVRSLELLDNPGPEPVIVDVVLTSPLQWKSPSVVESSSGDAAADPGDDWVVFEDASDLDPFGASLTEFPPTALVLGGAGGARPSVLSLAGGILTVRWNGVTVPPGGRAAFLHALTPQADRARARASATRLAQLPPELLFALEPEEGEAIRNFAVPAESALASLPLNDGFVQGRLLAGDRETPVPSLIVVYRSRSPHYGRPLSAAAGADGSFRVESAVALGSAVKVVPREDFDLKTSTPSSVFGAVQTAAVAGTFPASSLRDLARVPGTTLVASSTSAGPCCTRENATDGDLASYWSAAAGDSAAPPYFQSPFLEVVLPDDATIHEVRVRGRRELNTPRIRRARIEVKDAVGVVLWSSEVDLPEPYRDGDIPVPAVQGARRVRVTSLMDGGWARLAELQVLGVADGLGLSAVANQDLSFAGRGVLEGHVLRADATPIANALVTVSGGPEAESVPTDAAGLYRFRIVPPGTYTVSADHPAGGLSARVTSVVVLADQKKTQDVVFPRLGSVAGEYFGSAGQPVRGTAKLTAAGFSRTAAAAFSYTLADVPAGDYALALTDTRSGAVRTFAVTVSAGQTTRQDVTFPPVGTAQVTVSMAGSPLSSAQVYWQSDSRGPEWVSGGSATAAGTLSLSNVVGPVFRVKAVHPTATYAFRVESAALSSETQVVPVAVDLPGLGTVTGTLRGRDGVAEAQGSVSVLDATDDIEFGKANVNPSGQFTIPNIPVGPFRLRGETNESYPGWYWLSHQADVPGELFTHLATATKDALTPRSTLLVPGQRDLWETTLAAGRSVRIEVVGKARGAAAALADPFLEVWGSDGTLVGSNDDRFPSDKNPSLLFTTPTAGTYVVVARAASGEVGGYRLGFASGGSVFRLYVGAVVEGVVQDEAGGGPVAGATVRLSASRSGGGLASLATVTTAADGRFRFASVPTKAGFVLELLEDTGAVEAQLTGTTGDGGEAHDVSLVRPGRGAALVRATVRGVPYVGLPVTITSSSPYATDRLRMLSGTTAADGRVRFPIIAMGTITATATDPSTHEPLSTTGDLAAGSTLDLPLLLHDSGDTVAPAAVTDLSGSAPRPGIVRLTFTAPGDDGSVGTATAYDLRYAPAPITEASFAAATPWPAPAPAPAGTAQIVDVTDLPGGVTWYFALRARDEAINWSPVSNSPGIEPLAPPAAGLRLWLRADEGVTTGPGDAVVAWADQSGSGNLASQASTAAQPLRVADELNGLPVVRFDGSSDWLSFASRIASARSVIWVIKETAATNGARHLLGDSSGAPWSGGSARQIWSTGAHANILNGDTRVNGQRVNGTTTNRPTAFAVVSVITAGPVGAANFAKHGTGSSGYWWGDLAELIVYDRPLTDPERLRIEEHLARKYALAVPPLPAPTISPNGGTFSDSVTVTLTGPEVVRYTTDGSEPTDASPIYEGPFEVVPPATVKAKAFPEAEGVPSPTSTVTFLLNADFSPLQIAGLRLWVRADAGADAPVGGQAGSWIDQSGQENHLTQGESWRQPKLVANAVNGLPSFEFDGQNDYLKLRNGLATIRTVFWVVRESAIAPPGYRHLLGHSTSYDFHSGSARQIWSSSASSAVKGGITRVNGVVVDGTVTDRPTAMSIISLVTTGPVRADSFSWDRTLGRPWWGDLAELVIYDQELSDGDRRAVEEYLAQRYGISLP